MNATIVTPWSNHTEFARDYWAAVAAAGTPPTIVIDNASCPPLPNGIRLDVNVGFCRANNIGLEMARTDAVVFLNNDIAATRPDWLDLLLDKLEPGVLVGAQLRSDPHAQVDGHPMPYLDGWCVAGMREDLVDLGGFDESLEEPAYYSDNMLCLEARAAGMVLREARVGLRHKLNGSTDPLSPSTVSATEANRAMFVNRARQLLLAAA